MSSILFQTYTTTTDPIISWMEFFGPKFPLVMISILVHAFIYIFIANMIYFVFKGMLLDYSTNFRLGVFISIFIYLAYIIRLSDAKVIYKAKNENIDDTRAFIDNKYSVWYFFG